MQVKGISASSQVLRVDTQRKNTCYTWRGNVTDRCKRFRLRNSLCLQCEGVLENGSFQLSNELSIPTVHALVCHSFNSIPKSIAVYVGVKSIIGVSNTENRTMPNVRNSREIIKFCCPTSAVPQKVCRGSPSVVTIDSQEKLIYSQTVNPRTVLHANMYSSYIRYN